MSHMNQNLNNDDHPENKSDAGGVLDPYFDLDHDGKVSISETIKADAELAETYAEDSKRAGGVKGWFGGVFSKLFKAVDKNK